MKGLDYKYQESWDVTLSSLAVFYRVAGHQCSSLLAKVHCVS